MSENPFLEPDDDRTRFDPGVPPRTPRPSRVASPVMVAPEPRAPSEAEPVGFPLTGASPLLAAASPLLQLLALLRNTVKPPDSGDLRDRTAREMQEFEQRARASGVPQDQLGAAHYALCASLDDVVRSTPWGSAGRWDSRPLAVAFHRDNDAGEGFFNLLGKLQQDPARGLPVLELMYLCLSLGFQGRYRLPPHRPGEVEQVRESLYTLIVRQRRAQGSPELSPQWKGVDAPYRPLRLEVPAWAVGATALCLLAAVFAWTTITANARSDLVYRRLAAAAPDRMPAIARPTPTKAVVTTEPTVLDRLRTFLKPEVDAGLVAILGTPAVPVIRIRGNNLFESGSATPQSQVLPLLRKIGTALKVEPGTVWVRGYTDNIAIRTVRFPSNFQLSQARAQAAGAVLGETLGGAERIQVEGHGEADPIDTNATPQGRERNRRIDIVLDRRT